MDGLTTFIERFTFSDEGVRQAALSAVKACFGPFEGWDKMARLDSGKFFSAVGPFTSATLSLASLKVALREFKGESRLHRIAYHFLVIYRSHYAADDLSAFRDAIWFLMRSGRAYRVLFNDDVRSFRNISHCRYYNQSFFCIVRTGNDYLLSLFGRFVRENVWTDGGKPTQERFDRFFAFVERVAGSRRIKDASAFSQDFFWDLIDGAHASGELKDEFVRQTVRLYRFGIRYEEFPFAGLPFSGKRLLEKPSTVSFLLDEYTDRRKVYVFKSRFPANESLVNLDIDNVFLRAAVGALLLSGKVSQDEYRACRDTFVESLGGLADTVGAPGKPFSEESLMTQVDYYRRLYDGSKHRSEALAFIKAFYIKVNELMDGGFFKNARNITYSVLTSSQFVRYLDLGFEFRQYNAFDSVTEGKRILFIVREFNKLRRNLLKEDHIAVDYSRISNPFYRSLAWRATTSTKGRLYRSSFCGTLRLVLPFLVRIKRSDRYPTPELDKFSVWDSLALVDYFEKISDCDVTYNDRISNLRDFVNWAKLSKAMTVDDIYVEILMKKKTQNNIPTNTPILQDEEITTLSRYFAEKATTDMIYGQELILFNLSVITPLRISHLCSLLREELVYDDKLASYIVRSTSKSTRGGIGEIVLGGRADELIRKALKISDNVGIGCTQEDLRDQVFIYNYCDKYRVFTPAKFSALLALACQACGLPHYTACNLRATYMTKAYVEASENGYANEFVLKLFSYHKRTGTTLEHYVNHSEALASLTDYLKRGQDWHKTIYPDEIAALKAVVDEYATLIDEAEDESEKARLETEMHDFEVQLAKLRS